MHITRILMLKHTTLRFSCVLSSSPPSTHPSPAECVVGPILQPPDLHSYTNEDLKRKFNAMLYHLQPTCAHSPLRNVAKVASISWWLSCTNSEWPLQNKSMCWRNIDQPWPLHSEADEAMRCSLCGGPAFFLDASLLLIHSAWHVTRISSWSDAVELKHTHTQPVGQRGDATSKPQSV